MTRDPLDDRAPNRFGWKVFTHDLRSPIQGGPPVWDGTLPTSLPVVALDTSASECAAGWNYAVSVESALYLAGLWPTGRPSRVFVVEASPDAIERGDQRRASALVVSRELPEGEIAAAIRRRSRCFGEHADRMADEQIAWRRALARPRYEPGAVAAGLRTALAARGLEWKLKEYAAASGAWGVWPARPAREAWGAWDACGDARGLSAKDAWDAWGPWGSGDVWGARGARSAWDACCVCFASLNGWVRYPPDHLTVGLLEAYENGLGVAAPAGPMVLGWAMDERA